MKEVGKIEESERRFVTEDKGAFLRVLPWVILAAVVVVLGVIWKSADSSDEWGRATLDGKELTYLWRYKDPDGDEVRGEFITHATGKTAKIDGRQFKEMAFEWREVPLTAGTYFVRVSEDGIETVSLGMDQEAGTPQKILQFPIKLGATWKFGGEAYAKIIRVDADFTDGDGKVWNGCVCVGIYNGPKAMGEMWFHPEIGSLASKVFFSNLGYNEQILKWAK